MIENLAPSSLQNRIISLASNAGRPMRTTEAPSSDKSVRIEQDRQKSHSDDLKRELILLSSDLNKEMKRIDTDVNFNYNDDIRGLVVTVREADGDKIVREIPSKEAIELMKKMHDVIGLIFDKKG